jgi:phage terminase small subunit
MSNEVSRKEDWGQLGPAMKALPNDKWRDFVRFYLLEKPGRGAQTNAARRAGFGLPHTAGPNFARTASRLMHDERMLAAIVEESKKFVRAGAPQAAKALMALIHNPEHKDHARAVAMLLDRTDPVTSHQVVEVTHRHMDADQEGIEELRALRQLGTSRDKLLELFGGNGLSRLEALEAADTAQRAQVAKLIEGEVIEPTQEGTTDGK